VNRVQQVCVCVCVRMERPGMASTGPSGVGALACRVMPTPGCPGLLDVPSAHEGGDPGCCGCQARGRNGHAWRIFAWMMGVLACNTKRRACCMPCAWRPACEHGMRCPSHLHAINLVDGVGGAHNHGGDDHAGRVLLGLGHMCHLLLDGVVVVHEAEASELRMGHGTLRMKASARDG
jgi:hypothetical protein